MSQNNLNGQEKPKAPKVDKEALAASIKSHESAVKGAKIVKK
jgi:hypothetical protein